MTSGSPTVILHWLPLGAGGTVVRICGASWERLAARREDRRPAPLFHSALEVSDDVVDVLDSDGEPYEFRLDAARSLLLGGKL